MVSRFLFAYPTANQDGQTVTTCIINIITMHAHLPKTIISDKGSAFVSQVIEEVINLLEIYLERAATKLAQTIGMLEKAHASTEKALEIETGEQRSIWHKYINFAFLNYITTYHTSNGCNLAECFMDAFRPLSWIWRREVIQRNHPSQTPKPPEIFLEHTAKILQDIRKNAVQVDVKYKTYWDKKAKASNCQQCD